MRGLLALSIALICVCMKNATSAKVCMCPPMPGAYPPGPGYPPAPGHPGKPSCHQKSLFGISNTVTGKLVKQIIDSRSPNTYESFAISVFNILHALLVTTNAACGKTLKQLLTYLSICDLSEIDKEFKNYLPQLQQNVTNSRGQKALVRTYAGLFPAVNFTLEEDYVRKMNKTFGADARTVPYATNPQKAVDILNDLIKKATYGFYSKFFSSPFDLDTVLVIVSTLYVQVPWLSNYFSETSEQPFNSYRSTRRTNVKYLNNGQGVGPVGYALFDGCKFVQIPTYLDQFTFIAFYPLDEKKDPASFLKTLTSEKINRLFKALQNVTGCTVNVTIPEFQVNSTYSNLIAYLEAAGVKDLFTKADLCKAVKPKPVSDKLKARQMVHEASATVNKEGLKAAAATAVVVTTTAIQICTKPLKQFHANRAFGYCVADKKNRELLFVGVFYG